MNTADADRQRERERERARPGHIVCNRDRRGNLVRRCLLYVVNSCRTDPLYAMWLSRSICCNRLQSFQYYAIGFVNRLILGEGEGDPSSTTYITMYHSSTNLQVPRQTTNKKVSYGRQIVSIRVVKILARAGGVVDHVKLSSRQV